MTGIYQSIGAQHLSSVVGFSRDWLLTSSSRRHKRGSRTGGEPSSVVRRMIIPPAHRCWPNFGAPPRAANTAAHECGSFKEPSHACDSISPSQRKSERRAARALDRRRRSQGGRRAIDGIRGDQLRRASCSQSGASHAHSRHRSARLAPFPPQLHRGRREMITPKTRNAARDEPGEEALFRRRGR
jgi:hypothetical protein